MFLVIVAAVLAGRGVLFARVDPGQARAIIDQVNAAEFGNWFDPIDVLAIIEIESGFYPNATRYEPRLGMSSMGLMQLLPSTARDRGLLIEPDPALFDPVANITFGMRQMRWSWDYLSARFGRAPTYTEWIGSYNAGVGNIINGNVPAAYVARWIAARSGYA